MRKYLIAAALVFGIPLLTFAYFYTTSAAVVFLRNAGDENVTVSLGVGDGAFIERTDDKTLGAGRRTLIIFFPKIEGDLWVNCSAASGPSAFGIGRKGAKDFLISKITLESCRRLVSKGGFTL